ncbi:hypothetical protein ANME2D_02468 [Candidatus Methanoperedens nitroreducens]|uniref:Uncharacterized protein n=1 Tax=Candidatus Methanoperedens nitratireducens TaxID=1392998 RepID=A0A062UW74_9EURY|nr:hypothetical protein [Candidatus Methanoperedens nitroreducens]KCZ71266.1 hypothetical protein ANME2D_02468 [Candidatus Methanoperedens nitroreducens]MDJ1420307.1 hypothetical protein [Candidatus Methanoperedens sp.]
MSNTIAVFVEGMAEIFAITIISVTTKAFTTSLSGANWDPLITTLAFMFVAALIINFLKGVFVPFEAAINVGGMFLSLFISAAIIWRIAPDAVIEVISYIIAAIIGIYFGVKIRSQGQEQPYYRY